MDPGILPQPVVVPSALPDLVREIGRVVTRLCYALSDVTDLWEVKDPGAFTLEPLDLVLGARLPADDEDEDVGDLADEVEVEDQDIEDADSDRDPGEPDPDWSHNRREDAFDQTGDVSWHWLLDERPDATHVRAVAVLVCRALSQIAGQLLPGFITGEYRLKITPAPPTAIDRDDRVRVQLLRLDTAPDWLDEHDGLHIDLDEIASGYRLWTELALRETLARGQTLTHLLHHGTRCLRLAHKRELDMPLDDVHDILRSALRYLHNPRLPAPDPEDIATIAWAAQAEPDEPGMDADPRFLTAPRRRMYLIDEPEQRLHPALQRRAARWLTTLMSEWGAQCVLATHTLAFIPTAPNTHAYQLTRTPDEPDSSTIEPLDTTTLTPYAHLAQTIGLDRGELLTRWRAIVFADPLLTQIIDQLAGEQLEQGHIHLIALDPADHRPPPEIALLADLTAAPLILLTPTPSQPETNDNDNAPPATLALERLATELELHLDTIQIDIAHPLDLLNPTAITDHTHDGHSPFPGHPDAHQLHAASPQATLPYPQFLHTTDGITTDPAAIHAIAKTMRERDLPLDPQLTDALWHIERIALAAETP